MKNIQDIIYIALLVVVCAFIINAWIVWHDNLNDEINKVQAMEDKCGAQCTHDYYTK